MPPPSDRPSYEIWERGNRLVRDGRFQDAIVAYSDAIRRDPEVSAYYHNRAIARAAGQDPDGAKEDAWRAIELEPGSKAARGLDMALRAAGTDTESELLPGETPNAQNVNHLSGRNVPLIATLLASLRAE